VVQSESYCDLGVDLCEFRDDKQIACHQAKYVRYFRNAPGRVVDLGCGRGIMLQLLNNAGIECYGVDRFPPALEICKSKGLQVIAGEVTEHLRDCPTESLGGIFCSHVVEHFFPPAVISLCREAIRTLRLGGRFMIITPNSKDLNVIREIFWLDVTHVRLYPDRLLKSLLTQAGFREIEIFEDKDTRYSRNPLRAAAGFVRKLWLWGLTNRGDLVVVGTK